MNIFKLGISLVVLSSAAFAFAEPRLPTNVPEKGAQTEIASLVQRLPLLKQNLRPFQTLVVRVVEEKFSDQGAWAHVRTSHVCLDLSKNFLKIKAVERGEDESFYYDMSYLGKILIGFSGWIDKKETNVLLPSKIDRPYGFIKETRPHTFANSRLMHLWFYYVETPGKWDSSGTFHATQGKWILDLFQDAAILNSSKLINQPNQDEVHILTEDLTRFVFSKSKNMVIKRIDESHNPNGIIEELSHMEVVDFVNKDGWYFPKTIVQSENGKPVSRQTIDTDSIEINKPLSFSDFSVKIPMGTKVLDEVKNSSYVAARDITSMDLQNIETQLKDLLEKAKKDTK